MSAGHAFVRPGQVAAGLPPPDACVRCGLPEHAHGTGAELAARRTAAGAVLADFGRFSSGETVNAAGIADWQTAALRLSAELRSVLDQLAAEPAPPALILSESNGALLGQALADAIAFREPAGICPACDVHPAGLCDDHAGDLDTTDAYLALARELGIEVER
jgi:hypothetical protein